MIELLLLLMLAADLEWKAEPDLVVKGKRYRISQTGESVHFHDGLMDVYARDGHRLVRRPMKGDAWLQDDVVRVGYLDEKNGRGLAVWAYTGDGVNLVAFPDGWTGKAYPFRFDDGEFTTTGSYSVAVSRDPKTGLLRIQEDHDTPYEKDGQTLLERSYSYYPWDFGQKRFKDL